MRIVFFGTPELAVPSLAALSERHDVTALVCQPDRPKGRKKVLQAPPTKVWAEAHGLAVQQPVRLNDESFETWLRGERPEACALVAYGRILKQPILDVPRHGFLNMHPSALPKYRGPAPIQGAILNGETETAVTIMRLDAGMDSGDILLQEAVAIAPDDTAETLSARLAERGAEMMVEALRQLESGEARFTPQEHDAATFTKMIDKRDGAIDWAQPARAIHNLVRAAQPWPMAQATLAGEVFRIHRTRVVERETGAAPGTVVEVAKDRLLVATGDGVLAIETIQAPGKRALPMDAFLRGRSVAAGERFDQTSGD